MEVVIAARADNGQDLALSTNRNAHSHDGLNSKGCLRYA